MELNVALASLRSKLQELTEVESSVCSSEYEALFTERLHSIREEFPNSIQILTSELPLARYQCAEYAFKLYDNNDYQFIKLNSQRITETRIVAEGDFVEWLLAHEYISKVSQSIATEGDLAFYYNDADWQHTGILSASGRIASKWGNGLLCCHEPLEVPQNYGCSLSYWNPLQAKDAYLLFTEYAKERGFPFNE